MMASGGSQIIPTNKPTPNFSLQARCPSCRQTNSVTALKGKYHIKLISSLVADGSSGVCKMHYFKLRLITKNVAPCTIFELKIHKSVFAPTGGAYSAPQTPWLVFRGLLCGREGEAEGKQKGSGVFPTFYFTI